MNNCSIYPHMTGGHLLSLNFICTRLFEIESQPDYLEHYKVEHTALSHSSVLLSSCLLEDAINDLFCDSKYMVNSLGDLSSEVILKLCKSWDEDISKNRIYGILKKYTIALSLINSSSFDKGKGIYQEVSCLIDLRNALYHNISEVLLDDKDGTTISSKLYNKLHNKFSVKRGLENAEPFFPGTCFGAGCAKWSAITSVNFIRDFYRKAGLVLKLDHINKIIEHNGLIIFSN